MITAIKVDNIPVCPHCSIELKKCQAPTFNFGDGLGFGTDYFYVCFNDECMFYVNGWKRMEEKYGQKASYRFMKHPDMNEECAIPVMTPFALRGNILNEEDEREMEIREATRLAFSALAEAIRDKDLKKLLDIITNEDLMQNVRNKALDYLGDHYEHEVIDPLRNHTFEDQAIDDKVNKTIEKIHSRHFTRECPYCAEVIKAKARICKHCKSEL
jgi:hypothetical protein